MHIIDRIVWNVFVSSLFLILSLSLCYYFLLSLDLRIYGFILLFICTTISALKIATLSTIITTILLNLLSKMLVNCALNILRITLTPFHYTYLIAENWISIWNVSGVFYTRCFYFGLNWVLTTIFEHCNNSIESQLNEYFETASKVQFNEMFRWNYPRYRSFSNWGNNLVFEATFEILESFPFL